MVHEEEHNSTPSEWLVENLGILPVGRALDVAMGSGRNSVYLARAGFSVAGVDRSAEAVSTALQSAKKAGVYVDAKIADLEADYYLEQAAYDLIICFNYLFRPLVPEIKAGLRAGGFIVYETFTIDQPQFGHPKNPAYLLNYNELLEMFQDFRCLRYREGIFDGNRAIASIVAQKY